MTTKRFKELVKSIPDDAKIMVASDEEWNFIFGDIEIANRENTKEYIIYGFSGSEVDVK